MGKHTRPRGEGTVKENGYIQVRRPGHPVAGARGFAYLHRVNLYDAIGPGAHLCHYCPSEVTWGIDLEADHSDRDRSNNDPSNLVPCCGSCNRGRWNAEKTGCPHGHGPYDARYANGDRYCKRCKADKEARRRARLREEL